MFIHISKAITTTVTGRRLEAVTCEKCGTHFFYELTRTGEGRAEAHYYMGQRAATARSHAKAERDLEKRLAREVELVPCPKCDWVNEDLIERYRCQRYRGAPVLAAAVILLGIVVAVYIMGVASWQWEQVSESGRLALLVAVAVCLPAPVLTLLIRRQMRRGINPNLNFPGPSVVPAGTPPAMVERRDARSGEVTLELVPREADDMTVSTRQWAVFRPGQIYLPAVCCVCLAPATTTYASPFTVDQKSEMKVPLCKGCRLRLMLRWWLVALAVTALMLAVSMLIAMNVKGVDQTGRWILFSIGGLFATLVALAVVPSRICRPYRYKVVDRDRGIMSFSARNQGFTDMLIEQVAKSEGSTRRQI